MYNCMDKKWIKNNVKYCKKSDVDNFNLSHTYKQCTS